MKKTVILLVLMICSFSISVQAQDIKSILTGIVQTAVGDKLTTENSVIGTWSYSAPACILASEEDDILSNAGSSLVSTTAESTLTKVYSKIGFDKCIFTFNEDGTYTTTAGKVSSKGTYTFNAEDKTITFKTKLGISYTAKVSVTINSMSLTFKADKALTAVKAIAGIAGSITSYAQTINSLANKYNGLSLGFELAKK
jgi:hypothetical protein